jgi:SPP1 gp7 family putative phage head morphogenesis protein
MDDPTPEAWTLINDDARAWASQYAGVLVQGITTTSATVLQGALADYISGALTYQELIDLLAPTFGAQRAELISTTEITRAFSEGNREAWARLGVITQWTWETVADERVCDRCGSLDGSVFGLNDPMPPAHGRCRCFTAPFVGP